MNAFTAKAPTKYAKNTGTALDFLGVFGKIVEQSRTMTEEVIISARVPKEFYERLKAKAKDQDITVSQIVRRCLREWLKELEAQDAKY